MPVPIAVLIGLASGVIGITLSGITWHIVYQYLEDSREQRRERNVKIAEFSKLF